MATPSARPRIDNVRSTLRLLYHGHSLMALRFQSVLIVDLEMIVGISLFVQLAQAVFRPHKVLPTMRAQPRRARHGPLQGVRHLLNIPDEGHDGF